MLRKSEDILKNLKTASDIVQYVLNNDVIYEDSNRLSAFNPCKINTSAFEDCTLKDFDIHSPQSNMLTFYPFTKYDFNYASDVVDEIFRFMTYIVAHCNNGKGIIDKPLYVSIVFYAYDYYDESFLMVDTFSKCYNDSKVQTRTNVVGTTQKGLYHFDKVLEFMKNEGGVLNVQGGNYVLNDFPYLKTVRSIDRNELLLRKPFVFAGKRELKLLLSKPITMKRYFDLPSLQALIDRLITSPKNYLMWDSTKSCFKIIHEES